VPCEDCLISNEENKSIIEAIKAFMKCCGLTAYNETEHKGFLRHIVIKNGFHTNETMVCLVVNASKFKYSSELTEALASFGNIKSVVVNYNTEKTNVILGKKTEIVYGEAYISDYIGDLRFNISPLSFFQVNPRQTERLYQTALDFAGLKGSETVIDAYCGIGTISLFLARRAKKVYGVEIVPEAIAAAKENAALNNIENAEFFVGKSEEVVPWLYEDKGIAPDVMVVDPPRKGCDEALLKLILDMQPHTVVYVSCDSATLARDLKILCEEKYAVERVQPVDMFPHTGHIETVCLLSKLQ
jgi:23S rRNA (uracil1939-C5)-methyltransferase